MNFDVFQLVGGGIHLGDDDVFLILELLAELVPNGRQLFAVSAPRSVEFHQHVLGRIFCHGFKVFADQHFHRRRVPISGNLEGEEDGFLLTRK